MRPLAIPVYIAACLLYGCARDAVVVAPPDTTKLQPPLVITERQKEKCNIPEAKLGQDKLSLIALGETEIIDCDDKRAALQAVIEAENSKRAKANEEELRRIEAATAIR